MAHFPTDQPRPTMRRKSSAQNLLSFGKQGPSSIPPPLNLAASGASNSTTLSFGSAITPTATTPLIRDNWDAQSLHSDSFGPTGALAGAQSPPLGEVTTVQSMRALMQKRIITLTYIRNIHEGRSHWFHTLFISHSELQKVFNNTAMKKRTYRFAILALSLSTLLDINQPQDLLRGLLNVVSEYDQAKEEGDNKSKMLKKLTINRNAKKGASGNTDFTSSETDASYLFVPPMAFPLDYHQTLLSLLDVVSEVYNKISKLLGPSPFPQHPQYVGTFGPLSPYPGVSYLFTHENQLPNAAGGPNSQYPNHNNPGQNPMYHGGHSNQSLHHQSSMGNLHPNDASGSLWSIANGSPGQSGVWGVGGSSPPVVQWTASLGEMVAKIDSKLKKITTALLKDLDTFARNGIKDELASLDPLLRNLGGQDDPSRPGYDFDGM